MAGPETGPAGDGYVRVDVLQHPVVEGLVACEVADFSHIAVRPARKEGGNLHIVVDAAEQFDKLGVIGFLGLVEIDLIHADGRKTAIVAAHVEQPSEPAHCLVEIALPPVQIVRAGIATIKRDENFVRVRDRQNLLHALGDRKSEEHTSELQSLMRNSYAVFCLKKKTTKN